MKKKNVMIGATLLSCLIVVAAFTGCGSEQACTWSLTPIEDGVDFHTAKQKQYLEDDYTKISTYAKGTSELSRPEAITFEWSAAPKKAGLTVEGYTLEISTSSNFKKNVVSYTTAEPFAEVYNLCVDTLYYWRVQAEFSNGKKSTSKTSSFLTADTLPRNIYVDGITNVRDLGGWLTEFGTRVPQGLIYRCGRLNKSKQPNVEIEITPAGIDTMLNVLNVRTEIDLRNPELYDTETGGITESPLGESVDYINLPMEWNVGNILTDPQNRESVQKFFSVLADESSYPIIFHCNIGTDRTGLFAYLLNGLLGVSKEDLYRDYLFSNFGNIEGSRSLSGIQDSYVKTVEDSEGDSLSEKIYNCLVGLGVPEEELISILNIFA